MDDINLKQEKKTRVGQYLQNVKYAQHFNFLRFANIFLRKKV